MHSYLSHESRSHRIISVLKDLYLLQCLYWLFVSFEHTVSHSCIFLIWSVDKQLLRFCICSLFYDTFNNYRHFAQCTL